MSFYILQPCQETSKCFEVSLKEGKVVMNLYISDWWYLKINEWGWVSYEELWRSRRVLSAEAVTSVTGYGELNVYF